MPGYVIQPRDTLSEIAQRVLGSASRWREIAALNGIAPGRETSIQPGQVLQMPGATGAGAASPPPTTAPAPTTGPLPTTGAVPRPRPQQVAAMDPMAAPLPQPNPSRPVPAAPPLPQPNPMRGPPPLPPQNPTRPNVPGPPFERGSQMVVGRDPPGYVPGGGWRPVPGGPADVPSPITPQMEAYAANPGPRSGITSMGTRGLPDLRAMSMPEFTQLRDELARVPSRNQTPGMLEAVEAESRRRVEQLQAELGRIDQSRSMQLDRADAWQRSGQTIRQNPPQPYNPSIGEGEYLPQEQRLLMQLQGNQNANPQAVTSPQTPFRGGFQTTPQLDPVTALIEALRSGGQGGQANNPMLMRLLQGNG